MGNRSKKWACCAAMMAAGLWMAQGSAPMALTAEAAAQPGNLIEQEQPENFEGFVWRIDSEGKELPRNFRTSEGAVQAPDEK